MRNLKDGRKILFISEALSAPFDEGIKNVAFSLHNQLGIKAEALSVTIEGNNTDNLKIRKMVLNKLFINNKLRRFIKDYSPDIILYLPEASVTINSFLRAKVLKFMNSSSMVVMLGVKHISYAYIQKKIIAKFLRPDYLMLLGRFEMDLFLNAGMRVRVLPPAVDNARFSRATKEEKSNIRADYNVPVNKTVVLHVGHVRSTRNVESLLEVQKIDNVQVVVVGSTSTVVEKDLKDKLERAGIRVIDKYVPDIADIYKMSDIYVFPVFNKIACIDMPLSIIEAMVCNLAVITTRFGGLMDHFKEDAGFKYFDTMDELIKLVKLLKDKDTTEINNNIKVESFTWGDFTEEILLACDVLE